MRHEGKSCFTTFPESATPHYHGAQDPRQTTHGLQKGVLKGEEETQVLWRQASQRFIVAKRSANHGFLLLL